MNAMIEETGAVLWGGGRSEMAEDPDWYVGNHEFQVPIFVVTHRPPPTAPKQDQHLTFTFVADGGVESAIRQARASARERAVAVIGGVSVIRQLLQAGLVDELHVDLMPVLLGAGPRLFDDARLARLRLEKIGVQEIGARTSLRFRVRNESD